MDCVNHRGTAANTYCQSCGRGFCPDCIAAGAMRSAPGGRILCAACLATTAWQPPYAAPPPGTPTPTLAAVLGFIFPGAGAMYNGQFSKGLIHVLIFAVLVSAAHLSCIFGIFIAAWVFYQSIEAYHTARAMRDGLPLPDPLGLNEVGNWLNLGGKPKYPGQPDAETTPNSDPTAGQSPAANAAPNPAEPSFSGYQPPFAEESQPPNAPPPSHCWRRKEPIGAIVLIALGLLFLLDRLDIFSGRLVEFAWPLGLIALGIWLIVRRIGDSKGDCK